jgi:hypothetical protein
MTLTEAIERAYSQNEQTLATQIAAPRLEYDAERLQQFADWCKERGVRPLPAAPATIAAFVRDLRPEEIPAVLADIEALHSNANLANPIATTPVRAVLQEILKLDPPRWNKPEQLLWAALPPEVRGVISRRDKQTSTLIRRLQNENADLKKQLSQMENTNGG